MLRDQPWTQKMIFNVLVNHCLIMPDDSQAHDRIEAGALVKFDPYGEVRPGDPVAVVLAGVPTARRLVDIDGDDVRVTAGPAAGIEVASHEELLGRITGIAVTFDPVRAPVDEPMGWLPHYTDILRSKGPHGVNWDEERPDFWKRSGPFQYREDWTTPAA